MNRFEELRNSLEVYRDSADKIISEYVKKDKEAKERYNDATYQMEHSQNVETYKRRLSEARSKSENRISGIIDDVQSDLKRWVTAPVDAQLLNTLTAIKTAGIKLNKSEIQALREKAGGNFIGEKFIAAIALDNGMKIPAANTEEWMKVIQDVRNGAMTMLNGYCSNGYAGKELLEPHYNNGIKYGETQPTHIVAMAEKILKPDSPLHSKRLNIG